MKYFTRNLHLCQSLLAPCRRGARFILAALGIVALGVVPARADYNSTVLALHPTGFWPLNETSGTTAFDASGNGNNGAYLSGVTMGAPGVADPPFVGFPADGFAASFSGSAEDTSCVTLTNLPINSATVTFTEWVYPTAAFGTTFWNAGQNAGLSANNGAEGYNWHGGSGGQWTYAGPVPPVGQWSFVAMVITPTNAVFYLGDVNGVLTSAVHLDNQSAVNFTTGTSIGGPDISGNNSGLTGSLCDVAVFNYSLTPGQIAQLYASGYGGISAPAAPTGLSAAVGNGQVSLSWNASTGATGYNVKRSTTSGGETTVASISGTSYTGSGLANGTTYYYEVSATNSGGESANSLEVSATPTAAITNYSAGVLALSPSGFWPLNEASGTTAFDISGNGNNGAYQSAVALGVAGESNPPYTGFAANNRAAGFRGSSGTSSCVTLTNLPVNSANVTIMEWVYPTSAFGTTFWNAGQNAGLSANNGALGYNWQGGSGWQWTYAGPTPPVNQWSLVAMVITPTNAVFYMGNANGFTSSVNVDGQTAVDFTTGTSIGGPNISGNNSGFTGSLSDVAVFNYSLTGAQIAQLYSDSGGNSLPPTISGQPVSHNAYATGTTSFSVAASGATPLSYQWWHGTSELAGKTNAVLTLNNVQPSDAGDYSVVVANSYGSITSSSATLTLAAMPAAYESLILGDKPIGYWPLDFSEDTSVNTSGQYLAADRSGNNNVGTYNGMSLANQAFGPSSYIPNSAYLNGSGEFVDLSTGTNTAVLNIAGPLTMEAWVQPAASQNNNPADIFAKGYDYFHGDLEVDISIDNGDFVGGRDSGYYVAGSAATTNWTHVVCAYDGSEWSLYVDGELMGTNADPTGVSLDDIPWAIGNGTISASGRYLKGNVCQVALYASGLTAGQVVAHYAMGLYGTTNLAPIINTQPASERVLTNTAATFAVVATASPLPTYQWYSIIGGTTNMIAGATSATYTTAPVQDSDTGTGYFVVVSNSVGGTASHVAILTAGHIVTAAGFLEDDEFYGNYNSDVATFSVLYPTASSLPAPNKVEYLHSFNANADLPNDAGERIYGWFTPPVTGNYVFFEASDDSAALWLSTNSDPANVYEIAQNELWMWSASGTDWTCSNTGSAEYAFFSSGEWRSDRFENDGGSGAYAYVSGTWSQWPGVNSDGSIPLVGGKQYYIELDHYQGIGGQSAAVTYKLASDPDPAPGTPTLLTGNAISAAVSDTAVPERQPLIAKINIAGSKVTASGNNGLVNALYNVLTTTNLAAPMTSWTVAATGRFDIGGNFSFTNTVTAGSPQRFYVIAVPVN